MATAPAARAEPKDHSGRLLLRMPPELHSELARAAERDGTSLNGYITRVLSDTVDPDNAPQPPARTSRFLRIAVIVDLVMVAIATAAAVALLIVAWP